MFPLIALEHSAEQHDSGTTLKKMQHMTKKMFKKAIQKAEKMI